MNEMNPLRVLAVDDEEDHLSLFMNLLRRISLPIEEAVAAHDGKSALDTLRKGSFDCIFLDYNLPDMTGVEILKQIIQFDPDAAVLIITARGSEEIAVEAMKAGAMDYVVKGSLNREALERSLLTILERKRLRSTIRQQQERLLEAERQRVMLEAVGATCHHFSQPVTSLLGRLEMMLRYEEAPLSEKQRSALEECLLSATRIGDLLGQFQKIQEYRTKPYTQDTAILDID
jgi:CheY-like chemotaxis protein